MIATSRLRSARNSRAAPLIPPLPPPTISTWWRRMAPGAVWDGACSSPVATAAEAIFGPPFPFRPSSIGHKVDRVFGNYWDRRPIPSGKTTERGLRFALIRGNALQYITGSEDQEQHRGDERRHASVLDQATVIAAERLLESRNDSVEAEAPVELELALPIEEFEASWPAFAMLLHSADTSTLQESSRGARQTSSERRAPGLTRACFPRFAGSSR